MKERDFSSFSNISGSFFCPACGNQFTGEEFDMVTEKDNGYVVSVKCRNCHLSVIMNVVSADFAGFSDIGFKKSGKVISADDVIEVSTRLKAFDGNFRREFIRRK